VGRSWTAPIHALYSKGMRIAVVSDTHMAHEAVTIPEASNSNGPCPPDEIVVACP
jgi:hypothetical protein